MLEYEKLKLYLIRCAQELNFNGETPNVVIPELIKIFEQSDNEFIGECFKC
jgi:hypothetical protein